MTSERYTRQLTLAELGPEGQERIRNGRVLVVGAGGLGCPALLYLAGAGVGTIGIVDFDRVDASNLHRQVLYCERDLGVNKAEAAALRLQERNASLQYQVYPEAFQVLEAEPLVGEYDLVLDCTDDLAARRRINQACRATGRPMVYGAIHGFQGQLSVFHYRQGDQVGTDFSVLLPEEVHAESIPDCADAGVLGMVPGVIGTLQAEQALRILCGYGEVLSGKLFLFDLKNYRSQVWELDAALTPPPVMLTSYEELTLEEARRGSWQLLDVRETAELHDGPIQDAVHLPFSTLDEGLRTLDKRVRWLVVCAHGSRSRAVVSWLRSRGFQQVAGLKGGVAGLYPHAAEKEHSI